MFGKQKSQLCRIIAPRTLERWISGLLIVFMVASAQAALPENTMVQLNDKVARHTEGVRAIEQQLLALTDTRVTVAFSIATAVVQLSGGKHMTPAVDPKHRIYENI